MDWALIIAVITAMAAIIQAHHANAAAAEANRVAKQELESFTKREPKSHFAISAELKFGADGKNVVDGDELIVMNYVDAPSALSRHIGAQTIGASHLIFSQVWTGHGQLVEAMCNSIVVMPGEVKPIFTGEHALGSDIKQKADKGYYYDFPLFDGFEGRQIHLRLVTASEENLTSTDRWGGVRGGAAALGLVKIMKSTDKTGSSSLFCKVRVCFNRLKRTDIESV